MLALLATTVLAASPARAATPAAAPADTALAGIALNAGGVNLDAYCRSLGAVFARQDSSAPSGWSCQFQGYAQRLSIGLACQYQFAPLVAAGLPVGEDNGTNPAARRCLAIGSIVGNLGGMDLSGYCKGLGRGYNGSVNVGHTVDGWFCTPETATSRISLNDVCAKQHPSATLIPEAYFLSVNDAFRISCYGYR
jgi:hypothetical protein